MKHEEILSDDGMITCQLMLLEYNADVYVQPAVTDSAPQLPIDIPLIPIVPIVIPGVFDGSFGNVTLNQSTYGNVIVNDTMKTFGAGTQIADNPAFSTMASGTTFNNVMTPEEYDIEGANLGDYELTAIGQLTGLVNASYDFGMRANVDVVWANATATHSQQITQQMNFVGLPDDQVAPPVSLAKKMNLTVAGSGGAASDMSPANATVTLQGYSTIGTAGGFTRGLSNMGYQFLRVTKGEK